MPSSQFVCAQELSYLPCFDFRHDLTHKTSRLVSHTADRETSEWASEPRSRQ